MKLIGLLKDLIFCVDNERHRLGSLGRLGDATRSLLFGDWSMGNAKFLMGMIDFVQTVLVRLLGNPWTEIRHGLWRGGEATV